MRARFAVDFDGTLVEDEKYPDMGDWIPGAADAVRKLERIGRVVIYSCRVAEFEQDEETPKSNAEQVALIKAKLAEEGLDHLEIWVKPYKPPAAAYIDNKGIAFRGDWEETFEDVLDLIAPILERATVPWDDDYEDIDNRPRLMSPAMGEIVENRAKVDEYRERVNESTPRPEIRDEPTRHPSSHRFVDRVKSWIELHDQKQKDYGSDTDPFANIREGARQLGLPGWVGCVIRMNDKMRRLNTAAKQWIETGEVNMANEALIDSFDDLGVYSGIGGTLYEEES